MNISENEEEDQTAEKSVDFNFFVSGAKFKVEPEKS